MAFGVREEREREAELLERGGWHDCLAAELLGLLQVRGGVVYLDVEGGRAWPAVLGWADAAADAFLAGGDEAVARIVACVLDLPVEQLAVEVAAARRRPCR